MHQVIATSGDTSLGGDDFTAVIVDWIVSQCERQLGRAVVPWLRTGAPAGRLIEIAEQSKIALTHATETVIELDEDVLGDSGAGLAEAAGVRPVLRLTLSRARFESLSRHLLVRLLRPMREAALMAGVNLPGDSGVLSLTEQETGEERRQGSFPSGGGNKRDMANNINHQQQLSHPTNDYLAGLKQQQQGSRREARKRNLQKGSTAREVRALQRKLGDPSLGAFPAGQSLSQVVLVGGATRMPAVLRIVKQLTGLPPRRTVDPDEAVALGAAVMAGVLDGTVEDLRVVSPWQAALTKTLAEHQELLLREGLLWRRD